MESLFDSVRIAGSRSNWRFRKEELLENGGKRGSKEQFSTKRLLVMSQRPLIYQQEVLGGTFLVGEFQRAVLGIRGKKCCNR